MEIKAKDIFDVRTSFDRNTVEYMLKDGRTVTAHFLRQDIQLIKTVAERMQKKVEEEGCTQDQAATVLALMVEALHETYSINDPKEVRGAFKEK